MASEEEHGADREAPTVSHGQQEEDDENEGGKQNRSALADAIERGGLVGWASFLTFSWAGPFLKLGSTVTLKIDDLDGICEAHKRCVWIGVFACCSARRERLLGKASRPWRRLQ